MIRTPRSRRQSRPERRRSVPSGMNITDGALDASSIHSDITGKSASPSRGADGMNKRNTKAPETMETDRLLLRRPRQSDAQAVFHRYASDHEVTRYLSWPTHRNVADTLAFLSWSDAEWERWP